MKEIEAITKLATFQMICDGEADDDYDDNWLMMDVWIIPIPYKK